MADKCFHCKFYEGLKNEGLCRRFPPPCPTVKRDDWCGEWVMLREPRDAAPVENELVNRFTQITYRKVG